jgi:hypothetical protein
MQAVDPADVAISASPIKWLTVEEAQRLVYQTVWVDYVKGI